MKLLALDTSSVACSVALQKDADIAEEHVVEAKAHTRLLMPMLKRVLEQADCRLTDLDALILGNGPGSFIGMRIAASVAQGLCHGSGLPLVPVSSLLAVAAECSSNDLASKILVAQDARMNEVYLGEYHICDAGLAVQVGDITLQPGDGIRSLPVDGTGPWVAAGEGWHRYPALLGANEQRISQVSSVRLPRARYLLAAGANALTSGQTVDPGQLVPAYIRQTVAKIPLAADNR